MDINTIVAFVSLASTIVAIAYGFGSRQNLYVTRAEFAAVEKELRDKLALRERESVAQHGSFASTTALEKVDTRLSEELKVLANKVSTVQMQVLRRKPTNHESQE